MGALIDTSVFVHVERGNRRVATALSAIADSPVISAGISVGERDLMIAASALAYGHRVVTCDARSFGRVPGLSVETWILTDS
ncbi:MAG: hypothetical protein HY791_21680 [Deltaproteobacteria bacterium]|nr:hypothetical protein [Deltaproteobacteria bacterium]